MASKQDGFSSVCRRMQALMRERPVPSRNAGMPRLDEMIIRLGNISAEQRAA
ncbi:MAG: hypothetical protein ACSLE1_12190 [Sphingobium sp.]